MLDKRSKQDITKSFVHNSWKDMSGLLDKDLPVPPSQRNILATVLATLLLISVLAIGFLSYHLNDQIPTAELTKEKIIYKHIYLHHDLGAQPYYSLVQNTVNKVYSDENLQSFIADQSDNLYSRNILLSNSAFKPNSNEEGVQKLIDSKNIFENGNRIHFLSDNNRIENLESLSSEIDLNNRLIPQPTISKPHSVTSKRKAKYNLSLLTFATNNLDFTGYGLGSGIEIPLGKRLGITTGLAVNFVSRDHIIFPFFEKDNESEIFKSVADIDLKNQETFYSGLRSFKQIYLPLGISYQVNNFLALNSGVKFRYTYSENIDKTLLNKANRKLPSYASAENVFFNNTNIGLSAGISYKLSNNLSFNLDSEWGLSSLINRNNLNYPSDKRKYDLNLINLSTNFTF